MATSRKYGSFGLASLLAFTALCGLILAATAWLWRDDTPLRVTSLAISQNGATAAALFENGTIRVWSLEPLRLIRTIPDEDQMNIALSKDGQRLIGENGYSISTWDIQSGRLKTTWRYRGDQEAAFKAFSPDGNLCMFTSDAAIELREVPTGRLRASGGNEQLAWHGVFSPAGEWLAIDGASHVQLFGVPDLKPNGELKAESRLGLSPAAFSADGTLLAASSLECLNGCYYGCLSGYPAHPERTVYGGNVVIWLTITGDELRRISMENLVAEPVALADGRHFALLTTDNLQTWDAETGERRPRINLPDAYALASALAKDRLLIASDRNVTLWDSNDFSLLGHLWTSREPISAKLLIVGAFVWVTAVAAMWWHRRRFNAASTST